MYHFDKYDLKRLKRYFKRVPKKWIGMVTNDPKYDYEWEYLIRRPKNQCLKYVSFRKTYNKYIKL
jgi:hypothetical protein